MADVDPQAATPMDTEGEKAEAPQEAAQPINKRGINGDEEEGAIAEPRMTIHGEMKRPRLSMDDKLAKRSKRMFGMLNGTLMSAKKSTERKSEAEKRRDELEEKLAEKLKQEKEQLSEAYRQEMEAKQAAVKFRRQEEDRAREQQTKEVLRANRVNVAKYLQTKSQPPLYFLPKTPNEAIVSLLADATRALVMDTEKERVLELNAASEPENEDNSAKDAMDVDRS
ncbi:hypothetical protein HDU87_005869 [Geranomyces variabilis]|uniref:Pinin/SDK/MemA protein domain-containing protein n=1 Tax=Geranomyces variabilis TaxID=109894 RepID=A0AAD5TQI3_9FUNG|nr:hypothetical protein HDU87_005869 [Geranomyces variabilis]